MSGNHVLLIHGTWCNGDNWGAFATEMERRGFTVHAPSYRHHGAPGKADIWGNAQKVAAVGLLDYVADLVALVRTMDGPPIVVGHSVGALLAQLVAARCETRGLVLLGPAPGAGMFSLYPSAVRLWGRYLPQWILGKPMYPVSYGAWKKLICNSLPEDISAAYYSTLCAESGTAYRQMIFWFLDPLQSSRVDYAAVKAPVLVIGGSEDKCTPPGMCRATARKYRNFGAYVELEGSDHMMTVGPYMLPTLAAMDGWMRRYQLVRDANTAKANLPKMSASGRQ